MANKFLGKLVAFDWVWFLQWIITSDCDKPLSKMIRERDKDLDLLLSKGTILESVNSEIVLDESRELYKETVLGLKELSERQDKTLAMTLLAIGWNATTIKSFSGFAVLLSVAILLLLGRVFLASAGPITFAGLVRFENHVATCSNPTAQMQVALARQYEMARFENDFIAKWNQRRLLLASILLLFGLAVLMIGK